MGNRQTILLAEDDSDDVFRVRRALQASPIAVELAVARNGVEALQYLLGEGEFADRSRHPLPTLVLLDLDMPLMNGFEVLARMRCHPDLKDLPVVVLTGSSLSPDVTRAYRLGANSLLAKPTDFEHLAAELRDVIRIWGEAPPAVTAAS